MKSIHIGFDANGQPLHLTPELRKQTHMHVIGSSGTGKSKFLEWMIRKDIRQSHGFCFIDWHGKTYNDVLRYCAKLRVGLDKDTRKLILLNPSQPDFITGFNPFMNPGEDITVQVNNRVEATITPWGMSSTDQTPLLRRILAILFYVAAQEREPLPSASQLLRLNKADLREYAIRAATDPYFQEELEWLHGQNPRDWDNKVLSSENKLGKFLGSKGVRRYMGMKEGNLDLREVIDRGHILLVNLGASQNLDRESAKVFASLLLHELFEVAMERANEASRYGKKLNQYVLYLDEFQEYLTDDIAAMLDQVRKGGIHLVLAHQHLAQLQKKPTLLESVITNARIRAVFGGLSFNEAEYLANEMFLPDLNTRQLKKAYYHTIHLYEEQTRIVRSRSTSRGSSTTRSEMTGSGSSSGFVSSTSSGTSSTTGLSSPGTTGGPNAVEGWFSQGEATSSMSSSSYSDAYSDFSATGFAESESFSESEGKTIVPVWVPIPVQELGSETEWSLEEKRSKVAEILKTQQERHCFIKLDNEKTQPMFVPTVKDYSISSEYLLEYEQEVYQEQDALPAGEVDRIIADNQTKFISRAQQALESGPVIDITPEQKEEPRSEPARKPRVRPQKPKPNIYDTIPPLLSPQIPLPVKGGFRRRHRMPELRTLPPINQLNVAVARPAPKFEHRVEAGNIYLMVEEQERALPFRFKVDRVVLLLPVIPDAIVVENLGFSPLGINQQLQRRRVVDVVIELPGIEGTRKGKPVDQFAVVEHLQMAIGDVFISFDQTHHQ